MYRIAINTLVLWAIALLMGACKKNADPLKQEQQQQTQEEVQDGVKLGYTYALGKWHRVGTTDMTGQLHFAKNDLYVYNIAGVLQKRSFLRRFNEGTQTWVNVYEQLNPEVEKVATDADGNVYMAITQLRTEGWGMGTTKFFYTYTVQRLLANDQWESLGEIPNPLQASYTDMYLFHVGGKLHFVGMRSNKMTIYSHHVDGWKETAALDDVIPSGKFHSLIHTDGRLLFTAAGTGQPDTYTTYAFNGSQVQQIRQDHLADGTYRFLTVGEDGCYYSPIGQGDTGAILRRNHDGKELFSLPAVTISNQLYHRTISSSLLSSKNLVYAQVQRYVIPEWLNEVLAVYDTATGKTVWIPNTPTYASKAIITDAVNRGKRHYFALQDAIYYFEMQ